MFMAGGLVLFFLLKWTGEWIGEYFTRHPNEFLISAVAAIVAIAFGMWLYRNERVYTAATEVVAEVKKVTWPSRKETAKATQVVVVMSLISSLILYSFDFVWSALTDLIYG